MFTFCRFLDGTTTYHCRYEGPYKLQKRGKPSLARICHGDAITDDGLVPNMPFLQCEPAIEVVGHQGQPDTQYTLTWLKQEQQRCTKYKEHG